jgi:hypothetical protein
MDELISGLGCLLKIMDLPSGLQEKPATVKFPSVNFFARGIL